MCGRQEAAGRMGRVLGFVGGWCFYLSEYIDISCWFEDRRLG
jgi:hypothetical protein